MAIVNRGSREQITLAIRTLAERMPHVAAQLLNGRGDDIKRESAEDRVRQLKPWGPSEGTGKLGRLPFVAIASIFDHLSFVEKLPLVSTSKAMHKLRKEPAFWHCLDFGVYLLPKSDEANTITARRRDGVTARDRIANSNVGIPHTSAPKIIATAPEGSIRSISFGSSYNGGILGSKKGPTPKEALKGVRYARSRAV